MATTQVKRRPPSQGAGTLSVAIVGHQLTRALHPAHPVQIAQALEALGFDLVVPVTWGEELLARRLLYAMKVHGRVILCGCSHASELCETMGLDAAGEVIETVTPAIATARYVRALFPTSRVRVAFLDVAPAAVPGIDRAFSVEAVKASFVRRGIDPLDYPDYYDSIVPPDRRRHRSIPGGLPDPHALEHGYSLLRLGPADATPRFGASTGACLVQLLPGCTCGGLSARLTIEAASRQAAHEPPRSATPVVDEGLNIELVRSHGPRKVITHTPPAPLPGVTSSEPRRLIPPVSAAPKDSERTSRPGAPGPGASGPVRTTPPASSGPSSTVQRAPVPPSPPVRHEPAESQATRPRLHWATPILDRLRPEPRPSVAPKVTIEPPPVGDVPGVSAAEAPGEEGITARPGPRSRRGAELRWRAARASARRTPRATPRVVDEAGDEMPGGGGATVQDAIPDAASTPAAVSHATTDTVVPVPAAARAATPDLATVPPEVVAGEGGVPSVMAPPTVAVAPPVEPVTVTLPATVSASGHGAGDVGVDVAKPAEASLRSESDRVVQEQVAAAVADAKPSSAEPAFPANADNIAAPGAATAVPAEVLLGAPTIEIAPYETTNRSWVRAGAGHRATPSVSEPPVVEAPAPSRPRPDPGAPRILVTPRGTPVEAPLRARGHATPRDVSPDVAEPTFPGRGSQRRLTMVLTLAAIVAATVLALRWTDELCGGCIPKPYWEDGKIVWQSSDDVDEGEIFNYTPR